MRRLYVCLGLAAISGGFAAASSASVINNPGFEIAAANSSGSNGWSAVSTSGATTFTRDTTNPHAGSADEILTAAKSGSAGGDAMLFQDTPAGSVTGNTSYTLSFFALTAYAHSGAGTYDVIFFNAANTAVFTAPVQPIADSAGGGYLLNSFTIPAASVPATADHARLVFDATSTNAATSTSSVRIDDINFAAVPEPGTAGVLAACVFLRRKTRSQG